MNTIAAASSELPPTTIASKSIGTVASENSLPWYCTDGVCTPVRTSIPSAMSNTATAANRMVSTLRASLSFIIFLLPLAECFPIDRRASRRSGKRVQLIPHARSEDIDVGVRVLIGDYADVERSGVGERADTERHVADEVQQRKHIEQPRPGEVERPFGTGEVGALHVHPLTDYG